MRMRQNDGLDQPVKAGKVTTLNGLAHDLNVIFHFNLLPLDSGYHVLLIHTMNSVRRKLFRNDTRLLTQTFRST